MEQDVVKDSRGEEQLKPLINQLVEAQERRRQSVAFEVCSAREKDLEEQIGRLRLMTRGEPQLPLQEEILRCLPPGMTGIEVQESRAAAAAMVRLQEEAPQSEVLKACKTRSSDFRVNIRERAEAAEADRPTNADKWVTSPTNAESPNCVWEYIDSPARCIINSPRM